MRTAILCACLFFLGAAAPAAGQRVAWNQQEVIALAGQLDAAAEAFDERLEKSPPSTASSGTPESGEVLREKTKRLETASETLAERLGAGEGREKTESFYKNVSQLAADTAELARTQMLSEEATGDWERVSSAVKRLGPYYEAEAPSAADAERLDSSP